MGYRILYKEPSKSRREAWVYKTYATKSAAQKEVNKSIDKYKGSKYVKDVKKENFKIVKTKPEGFNLFGQKNSFGGFRI